jgi:hypothetical protein
MASRSTSFTASSVTNQTMLSPVKITAASKSLGRRAFTLAATSSAYQDRADGTGTGVGGVGIVVLVCVTS